ncbi:MAG: GntR family transcriptional regulator [Spirochaetia bacterium]|jgi:GntR family transcriptional regulator|nr:GntR family transcriptional regulator [Spirochaetia bacterium]
MQFKEKKAIYIQIADRITDNILSKRWKEEERIPSVREMAVDMEVNPNTIARTYGYLQDKQIINNKRGIGYFVASNAIDLTIDTKRQDFIKNELPLFFKSLDLLGMELGAIETLYKEYRNAAGGDFVPDRQ